MCMYCMQTGLPLASFTGSRTGSDCPWIMFQTLEEGRLALHLPPTLGDIAGAGHQQCHGRPDGFPFPVEQIPATFHQLLVLTAKLLQAHVHFLDEIIIDIVAIKLLCELAREAF